MSGVPITALHTASLTDATWQLVETVLKLFAGIVLIRILIPLLQVDRFNPVSQVIYRLTEPLIHPLRVVLRPLGRFDLAAFVLLLLLHLAARALLLSLYGLPLAPFALLAGSLNDVLRMLLGLYLVLIIVAVLLSWFGRGARHPIVPLIWQLTEPVLAPLRRVIPPLAGIDFSPLLAVLALQFLLRLVSPGF